MSELLISLSDLLVAAWSLLRAVSGLLLPWFPLAVWIGFWLCAVNWVKLREVLVAKGGLLGVLLIGAVWVLIWGVVAPPESGSHFILGLTVSNFVGKLVYVTAAVQSDVSLRQRPTFRLLQPMVRSHDARPARSWRPRPRRT